MTHPPAFAGFVRHSRQTSEVVSAKVRRRRALAVLIVLGFAAWITFVLVTNQPGGSTAAPTGPYSAPVALPQERKDITLDELSSGAVADLVDKDWVTSTAEKTGIPARALTAYAGVTLGMSAVAPQCHLSWNTLAGIGWVESHHGTIFDGYIQDDGTMSEPIYGIPLDGKNNTKALPDFDDGNFDGTAEFDRAVGPMQIIPPTWAAWHSDGNNDGNEDGQNIDDSTLAAARYLCFSGGDLATVTGWQKALNAYNQWDKYAVDVANKANEYAQKAG